MDRHHDCDHPNHLLSDLGHPTVFIHGLSSSGHVARISLKQMKETIHFANYKKHIKYQTALPKGEQACPTMALEH
jgi:hypothetical protein